MYKPNKVNGTPTTWKDCGLSKDKWQRGELQRFAFKIIDADTGEEVCEHVFQITTNNPYNISWKEVLRDFFVNIDVVMYHRNRKNLSRSRNFEFIVRPAEVYFDELDEKHGNDEEFIF